MTSPITTDARCDTLKIGLLSISDRASSGVYEDKGIPALKNWLHFPQLFEREEPLLRGIALL